MHYENIRTNFDYDIGKFVFHLLVPDNYDAFAFQDNSFNLNPYNVKKNIDVKTGIDVTSCKEHTAKLTPYQSNTPFNGLY